MNENAGEYIRACRASQANQDWWANHPLQRALQSVRAQERAQVRRAYRDLVRQMGDRT